MITECRYVASLFVSLSLLVVSIISWSLIDMQIKSKDSITREEKLVPGFFILLFISNSVQFVILVWHVLTSRCERRFLCSTTLLGLPELSIFSALVGSLVISFVDVKFPPNSLFLLYISVFLYFARLFVMLQFEIKRDDDDGFDEEEKPDDVEYASVKID